jgi:predicted small lipoprotein YifL
MRRIVGLLLLALLLVPTLAGCGEKDDEAQVASLDGSGDEADGDTEDTGDDEKSDEDQALEFAACMRENGVPDFPDPEVDGEGGGLTFRRDDSGGGADQPDRATVEKAMKACEDLAPRGGGRFSEEDRSKMQDAFLEYAACMREHGIDMPDPEFSEDGGGAFQRGGPGMDPDDPEFAAAHEACEDKLGETGPRT